MEEINLGTIRKAAVRFHDFADGLFKLTKAMEKGNSNPFTLAEELRKLKRKAPQPLEFAEILKVATAMAEQMEQSLARQQNKQQMAIVNALAQGLETKGLRVSGQLPELKAGPFLLVFNFGAKAMVNVYLGPKIALLEKVAMEPEQVVAVVLRLYERLFTGPFDADAFMNDLLDAYRRAVAVEGLEMGARVKIPLVMVEYAVVTQGRAFMSDPRRENYKPVDRIEFSCHLARAAKVRRAGDWEMRMDVAAMNDTKDKADHLWIPQGTGGGGVHYTTIRFVRRDDE